MKTYQWPYPNEVGPVSYTHLRVWGTDYEGESRTIDMHIKTLRKKLKEAGAMIQTVRNVGYVFNEN